MRTGRPSSLAETARRVQAYRAMETRLFELLGSWVQAVPEPEVKICLFSHAARHGEHAVMWDGLAPDPLPAPAGRLGGHEPGDGRLDAFFAAVGGTGEPGATADKLVGVYRVVLPSAIAVYGEHLAEATRVSDGPLVRGLALVLHDEHDARLEGEALIERLVGDDGAAHARALQARLQSLLVAVGGLLAPAEATTTH